MRLLDVRSHKVKSFTAEYIPPYAIMSHTWDTEEVTLQDIESGKAEERLGFRKILGCCNQAYVDGFDYVWWIDTCCIDKTSSAELSEAINSMFNWYGEAEICYAYLSDVPGDGDMGQQLKDVTSSRWFTRGWTLQELIAPTIVVFFAQNWSRIGTRSFLVTVIAQVTGIDRNFFADGLLSPNRTSNQDKLGQYSIAQKMSWASKRHTTRIEDKAYSLLGIFGVNIPLLYGEGKMAFVRLQEEIIKRSSDHSIFAWNAETEATHGFLADSPAAFAGCEDIVEVMHATDLPPYGATNKGIQITLPVLDPATEYSLDDDDFHSSYIQVSISTPRTHLVVLNCAKSNFRDSLLGLSLAQEVENKGKDSQHQPFLRHGSVRRIPNKEVTAKGVKRTMYLQTQRETMRSRFELWSKLTEWPLVLIRLSQWDQDSGFKLTDTWPRHAKWTVHESGMLSARISNESSHIHPVFLLFEEQSSYSFCLVIGMSGSGYPSGSIWTRLLTNVPRHLPRLEKRIWIFENKNALPIQQEGTSRELQETRDCTVVVIASAERRLFGALINLETRRAFK